MFQLKGNFKIIIPIIIFAIIAILTTIILIFISNKNSKKNIDNKSNDNNTIIKEKDIYGISSLTERYPVYELDLEYCENKNIKKISGLKNKEVENRINSKIAGCKYVAGQLIGNTISFIEYGNDYKVNSILNIRLDNGEKFNFEDIFLAETNIEEIISQAVNYYYSCKYKMNNSYCVGFYDNYSEDEEEQIKLPENFDIEDEIYKIINIYRDEGVEKFYVSHKMIEFYIGDLELLLPTESVWKEIAIYKRFLTTENIFLKDSKLNNYVLSSYRGNENNKFLSDNLFFEEHHQWGEKITSKIMNEFKKQNDEIKKEIQIISKNNPNNMYFFLIDLYADEHEGEYFNYGRIFLYKINKKDYNALGGEEFLALEQRMSIIEPGFLFNSNNVTKVDINDIIASNIKVLDKNGKIVDNYCYIDGFWEEKGKIIETWNKNSSKYNYYFIEDNCQLTLQN